MTLGERLRAAIDGKNISHSWVAEQADITPAALSSILNGKTGDPGVFTVLAIARAIKEPLSAIVDDPLIFWSTDDLARAGELGEWLAKRTTRGVLYPDAFELPRKRIPTGFARKGADARVDRPCG